MNLDSAAQWVAAVGGLGAASYGLVDASKAFWGGPSRVGFGRVKRIIEKLLKDKTAGQGSLLKPKDLIDALQASWINGVPLEDQKFKAKAFICGQLTQATAASFAAELNIGKEALEAVGAARDAGRAFTDEEQAANAKFEFALSIVIDEAYQRGDQAYRNFSKLLATLIGVVIAGIGGYFFTAPTGFFEYLGRADFYKSLLFGLMAAPLAPVTKDLASVLQAFAKLASFPKK